jgi:membrane protease YdiL (CAAX protease family)
MGRSSAAIGPGRRTPAQAGFELAAVVLATALALVLFPASHAAKLHLASRILVPLRLALLVLFASVLLWRSGGGWRALGLRRPQRLWLVPLLAIGGYFAGELCAALVVKFVYPLLHLEAPPVPAFLSRMRGDLGEYLYWMIPVTWGSAAFGEEMLFRGFMLDRLDQLLGGRGAGWAAAVLQALLFGAAHAYLGASGAIVAGVLGLVLGAVFLIAGRNLWPCILIHGLIDSTSITAVFLGMAGR